MLTLAVLLLVIALGLGFVGFGGLATLQFASVAQLLLAVFVILFLISAVSSAFRGRRLV